jgi:hypothetical protein
MSEPQQDGAKRKRRTTDSNLHFAWFFGVFMILTALHRALDPAEAPAPKFLIVVLVIAIASLIASGAVNARRLRRMEERLRALEAEGE